MNAKCLWFTGLPCSGKTTLAYALKKNFPNCKILDGDEIRQSPLGNFASFTPEDRKAHIIRMGYLAKMLCDQGVTVICSFVSPQREVRKQVREMFDENQFLEIYLKTPLSVCAHRDVKGMYAKAKAGKIPNFTGVQSAYEEPVKAEICFDTSTMSIDESCEQILKSVKPWRKPASLFIGRWNGVFHNGHDTIIQTEIQKGKHVTLAIRDVKPDEKNPWSASEVKEMLEYRYKTEPKVNIIIIPDIESVNYGRGVGYQVKEIKVVQSIAMISGTECRLKIKSGDPSWKDNVPKEIAEFLEKEKQMFVMILFIVTFLAACGQTDTTIIREVQKKIVLTDPRILSETDEEFHDFIFEFNQLNPMGISVTTPTFFIEIEDPKTLGLCVIWTNAKNEVLKEIRIDKTNYEKIYDRDPIAAKIIIFHELGHCELSRPHTGTVAYDRRKNRFIPFSIMFSSLFSDSSIYERYYAHYTDELFGGDGDLEPFSRDVNPSERSYMNRQGWKGVAIHD